MDPNTFCILPWTSIHLDPDGKMRPCCKIDLEHVTANINNEHPLVWWNSQEIKNLRQSLHQGVKHKHCQVCWNDESAGKSSLRIEYNKRFAKYTDLKKIYNSKDFIQSDYPIVLDLNLGNICNYKCIMCVPELSSKIQTERKLHEDSFQKLGFINLKNLNKDYSWPEKHFFADFMDTVKDKIKLMELKGGEPLLIPKVMETIKTVPKKDGITIAMTTNGSVDITDELIEELQKFKWIWLCVSVDGIEADAEYVRYGSKWSQVNATIKKLSHLTNCTFRLSTVLQFSSAVTLPDIVDYAIANNIDIEILNCYSPKYLSINALVPDKMKSFQEWAIETYRKHPVNYMKSIVGYLEAYQFNENLFNQCKQYFSLLEEIRSNHNHKISTLFSR